MKVGKDNLTRLSGDQRLGQHRSSEYLGVEDIFPDNAEPILTIAGLFNGHTTTQKGKENNDVLAFIESSVYGLDRVRPMIVNNTNRKTLRKLFGDATAATLEGKKIQLYVEHGVRSPEGGTTDGIRIRPYVRQQQAPQKYICADCGKEITAMDDQRNARWVAGYTKKNYGDQLCSACAAARKAATAAAGEEPKEEPKDGE